MSRNIDAAAATKELFSQYAMDVYRYARFTLGSATEAEDIVQEVFLRVLKKWSGFRGDANARTWLFTIARRCVIDRARKRKYETVALPLDEGIGGAIASESSLALEVEDLLRRLTRDQREVVVLRLVQDCSTEQAASILGWSQAKVKTTLHRAVTKLREEEGSNYGV